MYPPLVLSFFLLAEATATAARFLAPAQDIALLPGSNSKSPLESLGGNSPWARGPNVYGLSTDVPDNCYVDQAAYVSRHGSRYPDSGAYSEWKEMESRFSASGYTAHGPLAFLPEWRTVLTHPEIQVAMESPTGYKEAMDYGYQLRTRYPLLYEEGDAFYVWANNYTRVLQTAQNFLHGFIGNNATRLGKIVAVTSRGFSSAVGNSLAPSDMCPNFVDESGGDFQKKWDSIWLPQVRNRLQSYIRGNLILTLNDVNLFPYLCGFESQITGRLSPFCDIFTAEELRMYEYSNDLRYYYGVGPGTVLPPKMMTPFLNSLVQLLQQGPGRRGVAPDGTSTFQVPRLLMSFLNDGQLTELVAASGVFDAQKALSATERDETRLWNGSRFVTMRGTIAFERLNCRPRLSRSAHARGYGSANATFVRIMLNDQVYPVPSCKEGPGSSCPLDKYVRYVERKYVAQGDWIRNCNATSQGTTPTTVKGASFFTDLAQPHLSIVTP